MGEIFEGHADLSFLKSGEMVLVTADEETVRVSSIVHLFTEAVLCSKTTVRFTCLRAAEKKKTGEMIIRQNETALDNFDKDACADAAGLSAQQLYDWCPSGTGLFLLGDADVYDPKIIKYALQKKDQEKQPLCIVVFAKADGSERHEKLRDAASVIFEVKPLKEGKYKVNRHERDDNGALMSKPQRIFKVDKKTGLQTSVEA